MKIQAGNRKKKKIMNDAEMANMNKQEELSKAKIKTREEIKKIAESLRKKGEKIVTCNGSFDLLHAGHVKFLQEAKDQGDILIVGLNSNDSIHKYKNADRPIIDEKYRLEGLAALECVDYVILMDEEEIAVPLINLVKPDVHANGEEYGENCVEAEAVKGFGGKLYLVKKFEGFSTTELVNKIVSLCVKQNK